MENQLNFARGSFKNIAVIELFTRRCDFNYDVSFFIHISLLHLKKESRNILTETKSFYKFNKKMPLQNKIDSEYKTRTLELLP